MSMSIKDHMSSKLENNIQDELFKFTTFDEAAAEKTGYSDYSYWKATLKAFSKNKVAVFLFFVMIGIVAFTFIQPYLPNQIDPNLVNNNPLTYMPYRNIKPGDETFILGTNSIGQDLWARIWAGTRTSLFIGISVASVEAVVGITMGMLWGYVRQLDFILTEIYNVLDNIPQTLILILISYMISPSVGSIIFAMSLTGWIQMARFIRNQILIIRDRDYNLASRCLGTPTFKIVIKNLLPYLVSVIMLRLALAIPGAIGSEVFITYIGLGLPSDVVSLGKLINDGRELMMSADLRYQLIYPTIILSIVTVSFYVIGNAFSDAADPKNHK
ncbi:MAG: ABC transporter permease [Lachnospiraceae bacterium]